VESFLAVLFAAHMTAEAAWAAGDYATLSGATPQCAVSIDARSEFTRRCDNEIAERGSVLTMGNVLALLVRRDGVDGQAYARAAGEYYAQHFREHGFYPSIASVPQEAGRPFTPLAPVVFRKRLYLVDVSARESFCGAVRLGQEPHLADARYLILRSHRKSAPAQALPPQVFCHLEWRFRLE